MRIGQGNAAHPAYLAALKGAEEERKGRMRADAEPGDTTVKISPEARAKLAALESARVHQAQMPDLSQVREQKIREIEERIESGHYDSPAVSREISELLLSIYGA